MDISDNGSRTKRAAPTYFVVNFAQLKIMYQIAFGLVIGKTSP